MVRCRAMEPGTMAMRLAMVAAAWAWASSSGDRPCPRSPRVAPRRWPLGMTVSRPLATSPAWALAVQPQRWVLAALPWHRRARTRPVRPRRPQPPPDRRRRTCDRRRKSSGE
eukprot:5435026-Alexandrium_andersonii.AAC.1